MKTDRWAIGTQQSEAGERHFGDSNYRWQLKEWGEPTQGGSLCRPLWQPRQKGKRIYNFMAVTEMEEADLHNIPEKNRWTFWERTGRTGPWRSRTLRWLYSLESEMYHKETWMQWFTGIRLAVQCWQAAGWVEPNSPNQPGSTWSSAFPLPTPPNRWGVKVTGWHHIHIDDNSFVSSGLTRGGTAATLGQPEAVSTGRRKLLVLSPTAEEGAVCCGFVLGIYCK